MLEQNFYIYEDSNRLGPALDPSIFNKLHDTCCHVSLKDHILEIDEFDMSRITKMEYVSNVHKDKHNIVRIDAS